MTRDRPFVESRRRPQNSQALAEQRIGLACVIDIFHNKSK